jgi:hypothetical protein
MINEPNAGIVFNDANFGPTYKQMQSHEPPAQGFQSAVIYGQHRELTANAQG